MALVLPHLEKLLGLGATYLALCRWLVLASIVRTFRWIDEEKN